jgi:hypothetical protein
MPDSDPIWVFESQTDGDRSKGAAATALKRDGAELGQAQGIAGNSYAIPTRDKDNNPLEWPDIGRSVQEFRDHVSDNPSVSFKLFPGSARRTADEHVQFSELFRNMPADCDLPGRTLEILGRSNVVRIILLDANIRAVDMDARKTALDQVFTANEGLWGPGDTEIVSYGAAHTLVANDLYAKSRGYKHRIIDVGTERYGDDAKQVLEMLSIAYATQLVCIDDPDGTNTSQQVSEIHLGACAGLEIDSVIIR